MVQPAPPPLQFPAMQTDSKMECVLGIDVGTSRVKCALVNTAGLSILQESSLDLGELQTSSVTGASERSVAGIQSSLESCLDKFDTALLTSVRAIAVCGQMHGCLLWSSTNEQTPSNLITCQDGRCDTNFLSSLPQTRQPVAISSGYGCATLAWLQRHCPEQLKGYDRAGTIMDYVVWALVGDDDRGVLMMSNQNAAGWGYFDQANMSWETDLLAESGFPVHLLPRVVSVPAIAGRLKSSWHGIAGGVLVGVALGDMQCSVLAAQPNTTDAVLNIGTSSQLVAIKSTPLDHLPTSVLEVPYFSQQTLIVAASLSGGNVVKTFVSTLRSWLGELGLPCPIEEEIYARLMTRAQDHMTTTLRVDVRLWGERHTPNQRGGLENVAEDNASIGDVASALFRGIVENLHSMMTAKVLQELKVTRLLGSGTSLEKNDVLRKHTENVFGLPLIIKPGVGSPLGAAKAATLLY